MQRVVAFHSLTGFGHTSMTTAVEVFAALGIQCCPVPTVVLSTHGAMEGFTYRDLSDQVEQTARHYRRLDLRFDGVMSGYLGSREQMDRVAAAIACLSDGACRVLVDPVMGDNGKVYGTYTPDMCQKMKELVRLGTLITPNVTEAALLLSLPADSRPADRAQAGEWLRELSELAGADVVMTGLQLAADRITVAVWERGGGQAFFYDGARLDAYFPGTGDLFASVLLGGVLGGMALATAAEKSARFVQACIEHTMLSGTDPLWGVELESMLPRLREEITG